MRRWRLPLIGRQRGDEGGYVLVIVAAALPVLLIFGALTVDFGGWYVRASQIQRAADAAALAGVVWMPDLQEARDAALVQATQNGFTAAGDISVVVSSDPNNLQRLTVTIADASASRYFSQAFRGQQSLTRTATAEYVMRVPLGSPKNIFGSGDLLSGSNKENFWAAVNGYCAGHESGDLKSAGYESYSTSSSGARCNNGSAAAYDYDPNGYLYAVKLPLDRTSLKLEAYDAGYNRSDSAPDLSLAGSSESVTTVYQIYGTDNTPLDTSDNPLLSTITIGTNDDNYQNQWKRLYTWTNPKAGTYYVRVKTLNQTSSSRASNGFALRAFTGSSFSLCTTISGASGYSASCPQVHGVSDMSIFANLSGSTAAFYLAQIDPIHAGKIMRVTLFDPGEGAQKIEVLDPKGNPATFAWSTPCDPPTPPSGGCSNTNRTSLDVSGTGTQPYTGLQTSSKYNDRKVTLDIKLPANYSTAYSGKTWWQIRYTVGSASTDRTTWAVNIVGDPLHLVGG